MKKRAIVHFGTAKTGSTALQRYLVASRKEFSSQGVHILNDSIVPGAQSWDLAVSCVRPELDAPFRLIRPYTMLPSVKERSRQQLLSEIGTDAPTVLASMEDLSLIRTEAEVRDLVDVFGGRELTVVICFRAPSRFLESYTATLRRLGVPASENAPRDSASYVAPDSWLVDYANLIAPLEKVLGEDRLRVIDYESAVKSEGSILPSLCRTMELPSVSPTLLDNWIVKSELLNDGTLGIEPSFVLPQSFVRDRRDALHCRSSRAHRLAEYVSRFAKGQT